jgi:hypothetical protein
MRMPDQSFAFMWGLLLSGLWDDVWSEPHAFLEQPIQEANLTLHSTELYEGYLEFSEDYFEVVSD